jgi:hypothetical protein
MGLWKLEKSANFFSKFNKKIIKPQGKHRVAFEYNCGAMYRTVHGGEEGILPRSDSGTWELRTESLPARFLSRPSNF